MENNLSIVKDNFKELPNNIEAEQSLIGSILLSNEIFDDEVEGEICVRSPSVMLGYYKNQIESKKSLNKDRFLSTGDYGYRKDDLYFISSRRTDLILRGAENVYPQEIEILLDQYDGVAESAVIGVPHDDLGEEVKAIVVLENNKVRIDELYERYNKFIRT